MLEHVQKYEVETLGTLGTQQDKSLELVQDCKTGFEILVTEVYVAQPIDFPESGLHPAKGIWRIGYEISRCNESKRYNAFFIAKSSDEPPTSRAYYPGVSLANPQLIQDTMRAAVANAAAWAKIPETCKNIGVLDMSVSEKPDTSRGGTWQEMWSFKMCQTVTVAVDFVPDADGKGTSYRITTPPAGKNTDGTTSPP